MKFVPTEFPIVRKQSSDHNCLNAKHGTDKSTVSSYFRSVMLKKIKMKKICYLP